ESINRASTGLLAAVCAWPRSTRLHRRRQWPVFGAYPLTDATFSSPGCLNLSKLRQMKMKRASVNSISCLFLALWMGVSHQGSAADALVWRTGQVDAEIESWPLPKVLESIASATGWQIYVE